MEENVKVEEVEVIKVEDKKNWLSKKVMVIGGAVIGLGIAAVMYSKRNKDSVEANYIVIDNNETTESETTYSDGVE